MRMIACITPVWTEPPVPTNHLATPVYVHLDTPESTVKLVSGSLVKVMTFDLVGHPYPWLKCFWQIVLVFVKKSRDGCIWGNCEIWKWKPCRGHDLWPCRSSLPLILSWLIVFWHCSCICKKPVVNAMVANCPIVITINLMGSYTAFRNKNGKSLVCFPQLNR